MSAAQKHAMQNISGLYQAQLTPGSFWWSFLSTFCGEFFQGSFSSVSLQRRALLNSLEKLWNFIHWLQPQETNPAPNTITLRFVFHSRSHEAIYFAREKKRNHYFIIILSTFHRNKIYQKCLRSLRNISIVQKSITLSVNLAFLWVFLLVIFT